MPAKKIPIVCIDSKGEVVGYYESMKEAGKINGIALCSVSNAVRNGVWLRKHKWMKESDYRKYWMEGRISDLQNSYKEFMKEVNKKRRSTISEDERKRINKVLSEKRKAYLREHPEVIHSRKKILCVTTGEVFDSISDCARAYSLNTSNVCRSIRKGYKVKGLTMKYLEEEEQQE